MKFFFVFIENLSNVFADQLQYVILPYIFPWIDFGIRKFIWLQEKFDQITFFTNKSNIYKNILKKDTWNYTGFLLYNQNNRTYRMIHQYDTKQTTVACEMDSKIETLYIQQKENICICSSDAEKTFDTEPSKVRFLYVEFINKNVILSLDIPLKMMQVGNEILSPAFIYRLLDHQGKTFLFDSNYRVVIIDELLSSTEITFGNSIVLAKDTFSIAICKIIC